MLCAGYATWDDQTMKKRYLGVALAATLLLSGCSATDLLRGFLPSQTPSPSQPREIEPESPTEQSPVTLSRAAAAERYLQIVCQANAAVDALDDAWFALDDAVQAGGSPDITPVTELASEVLRLRQQETALLDDPRFMWPAAVDAEIKLLRDLNLRDLSAIEQEANAKSVEDLYRIAYPELTPDEEKAPQEIRLQLGLDANTVTSCTGYESDQDRLYADLTEYLSEIG